MSTEPIDSRSLLATVVELVGRGGATTPDGEPCWFRSDASLDSPSGEVSGARPSASDIPGELTQTLFGLFGTNGSLPHVWTEILAHGSSRKSHREFLALVDHTLIGSRLRDNFLGKLGNGFLGTRSPDTAKKLEELAERLLGDLLLGFQFPEELPRSMLVRYFSLFREIPSHAALELLLSDYFSVAVGVEPFQRVWRRRSPAEAKEWGSEVALDERGGVTLRVGPMDLAHFEQFLPGGTALRPLLLLSRLFVGAGIALDVRLLLHPEERPNPKLAPAPDATRLGYTSWDVVPDKSSPYFARVSRQVCRAVERGDWREPRKWQPDKERE